MTEHLTLCGLEKAGSHETDSFSIRSGGQIVFQTSDGWLDSIRLVLRYGLWSLGRLEYFVANLLDSFSSVYPSLETGRSYATVHDLLEEMSPRGRDGESSHEMTSLTKISIREKLLQLSISEELIEELAMVAMKVNYGQFPENIHGFVGSVSLAGIQEGLWRVQGGNYRIPLCLLQKSNAKLVHGTVDSLEHKKGKYSVVYTQAGEEKKSYQDFDIVVVAFPLTKDKSKVKLINIPEVYPGEYQRTLAYLVHGTLNTAALGFNTDWSVTKNIFFTDRADPVASISFLLPVDFAPSQEVPSVYKVFSREKLSRELLHEYFSVIDDVELVDWLAYPNYKTFPGLGSFHIQPNLYYLNNIEWAASAMEMSALAARNIANLIASKFDSSDENKETQSSKSEL